MKIILLYLKSEASNLSNCKISWNKENAKIWDQKSLIWDFFTIIFLKNYCHIWNQHTWICLIAKFHKKTKMSKFGTEKALFVYFLAEIWKRYFHIWNQQSWICLIAKFCEIKKMPKFGTKYPLVRNFWARILKPIVIFEISTLEIV